MELTCIRCPIGCHLVVTKNADGTVSVTGNSCPRGAEYGKQEMTQPKRTITTIKQIRGGTISVKTSVAVDKKLYFEVLKAIRDAKEKRSYKIGDIILKNVCGTNSNIVVTGVNKEDEI
mgnify:CR=1 FL=1